MGNKSLHDQLKQIQPAFKHKQYRAENEGVDHINILKDGQSLGKFLDCTSRTPFKHSIFGAFESIEGFWLYIKSTTRDDCLRYASGPMLKRHSKKLELQKVVNFRAIIMDTIWQKVKQHHTKSKQLKQSTLPFDCYFINQSGVVVRPSFFKWLIEGITEIRSALVENREPDFTAFLDVKDSTTYQFVLPSTPTEPN